MRPPSSTILLVESDPREVLRLIYAFAMAGHTAPIEWACDYPDAVAQLQGTGGYADRKLFPAPGLLILDLDLDQGPGFEILEWLQASPEFSGLPSVVLASSRQTRDVDRAIELGAHGYHLKPASTAGLCAMARDIRAYWTGLQA